MVIIYYIFYYLVIEPAESEATATVRHRALDLHRERAQATQLNITIRPVDPVTDLLNPDPNPSNKIYQC